jgi:pimeloyl-ACP methyl ester carboxylesterase
MYYEQQGSGEPLILIPYLAADHACYAFQVAEYSKHFTCFSLDLRGTGESDKPGGVYTTELFADDVSAFMQALGIENAHISGLSLGAGVGLCLAIKHPERVRSLSLHGGWDRTDAFLKAVIESWQKMANAMGNVTDVVIHGIFQWCLTPDLYNNRPDYIAALEGFVRSRPAMSVTAFVQHSNAVLSHDCGGHLDRVTAPTQITVGSHDMLTSTRFANRLKAGIRNSELMIFDGCAHAPLYEKVEEFNQKTLAFLRGRATAQAA